MAVQSSQSVAAAQPAPHIDGWLANHWNAIGISTIVVACLFVMLSQAMQPTTNPVPPGRSEVVFWHFWGGEDRDVVESVVQAFNASQDKYWVRAVAVPGNNLDAKLFMTVAGGNPPDLVNQDDPIVADWFERGAVQSVADFAGKEQERQLLEFLLPAAARLGTVEGQLVAVPNALDVRALYYNATVLQEYGLTPPTTIDDLNRIVATIHADSSAANAEDIMAFLPDSRRIWAWGYVFGGEFYDAARSRVTLSTPEVIAALNWMRSFARQFGPDAIMKFRRGDQSLPGKTFPLLPIDYQSRVGRYVFVMDGQWRVRDIERFQEAASAAGQQGPEWGVCPLPYPEGGRPVSGWVNGNFFLVPRGAANAAGAWEFMQFWIGIHDVDVAAKTCASGGWIPVSKSVMESSSFQSYLQQHPLFARFVQMADSDQLFPYPNIPGAMFFRRVLETAADRAMHDLSDNTADILRGAETRIQQHLDRITTSPGK